MQFAPYTGAAQRMAHQRSNLIGNQDPGNQHRYHDDKEQEIERQIDSSAVRAARKEPTKCRHEPRPLQNHVKQYEPAKHKTQPFVPRQPGQRKRLQNARQRQHARIQRQQITGSRHFCATRWQDLDGLCDITHCR